MKKITLLLAGVLVSAFAIASKPGEGSASIQLALVKKGEATYKLYYQSASAAKIRVTIADAQGKVVYRDWIKSTASFMRPYTFDGLANGAYTVTVDNGTDKQIQVIQHSNTPTDVKAANVLQLADNKYLLSVKGQFVSGKINVKIWDGTTLLHKQQTEVNGDFGQLFRLENITTPVSFEVTDSKGNRIN